MAISEGDTVRVKGEDDWGVVVGRMTENFNWVPQGDEEEGETIEASPKNPVYIVALNSGGSMAFEQDELEEYDRESSVDEEDVSKITDETEMAEVYHICDDPYDYEAFQQAKKEVAILNATEYLQDTYDDYPQAAVENAKMALEAREDTGNPRDCGTEVGWTRAKQLANEESLSAEVVIKMSQFNRHRQNSDMDDEQGRTDCGWMMWKAWGGDEGVDWAGRKVESENLNVNSVEELVDVPKVDDPGVGFDSDPKGWDRSSYLDAWASVGGTWTTCHARMLEHFSPRMAKRWCASLKDEILGTTEWRGRF